MIYRIYPLKDTTIYEDSSRKLQNTGRDEILEVGKFYDTDNETLLGNSRVLLQFDLSPIKSMIDDGEITGNINYSLHMENTEIRELRVPYDLYIFPLKESWDEGLGTEVDTPHTNEEANWVYRKSGSLWDVRNKTVDLSPTADGFIELVGFNTFSNTIGKFTLIDIINGENNKIPTLSISSDNRLILSSSNYGGATVNYSASLEANKVYNINFDVNVGTLTGMDFRIFKTSSVRYLQSEIDGLDDTLSSGTYTLSFTSSGDGNHNIQFTFFDENGNDGSAGSIDNFFLYSDTDKNIRIFDTFNVDTTIPSDDFPTMFINGRITGSSGENATVFASGGLLIMSASNYSGASFNRSFRLLEPVIYTASFNINIDAFSSNGIDFSIYEPGGGSINPDLISNYTQSITESGNYTMYFSPESTGTHYFRWDFFGSGSSNYSASLDYFKLETPFEDYPTSSVYVDTLYDANYITNSGGGTWYTASFISGSHYTQTYNKFTDNLDTDVTEYVKEWIANERVNNGFIVKKSKELEQNNVKYGSIKFFSSDTNTIYPPTLSVRWDDSSFEPGSLTQIDENDFIIYVKGLLSEYKENSRGRIRIYARSRYPARVFGSSPLSTINYLPSTTYYSIKDSETEQTIIPFDTTYTKVSCDSNGNYFDYWFNSLQPERFYRFVFRVDIGNRKIIIDDNFHFKIVR